MNLSKKALISDYKEELEFDTINPYLHEISEALIVIRKEYNLLWEGQLERKEFAELFDKIQTCKKKFSKKKLDKYPIGFCFYITKFCFQLLQNDFFYNLKGIQALNGYKFSGGVFKIIWGEIYGKYFQTAVQLGSYYIDFAYDTIKKENPPIRLVKLNESGFQPIFSVEHYIKIKEDYHNCKIYLNNLFPELVKAFPLIYISNNGKIYFDDDNYMKELYKENNWKDFTKHLPDIPLLSDDIITQIKQKINVNTSVLSIPFSKSEQFSKEEFVKKIRNSSEIPIGSIQTKKALEFLINGVGKKQN